MKQNADIICPKLIAKKAKEEQERAEAAARQEREAMIEKIIAEEELAKEAVLLARAKEAKLIELRKAEYWEHPKYEPEFKRYLSISEIIGACC